MYKKIRNKRGFTVIELIVAIAIAGIMIIISINLLGLTNKTHSLSLKEYDLQSAIRKAIEETNQVARYSKAVFAVPQTFVADTSKMDPGWNYIMVSPDGKRIITMEYDDSEGNEGFVERTLVPEHKNIQYEVFFEKESEAAAGNMIRYVVNAYIIDGKGNKTNEKAVYETTIESVNAVQVADKGTGIPKEDIQGASPSIALAYRSSGKTSGKGRNDFAYITLVVDVSGSMRDTPDGDSLPWGGDGSRIELVKKALIEDKNGIIQQFKNEENVYMSLIPFSDTANYPCPTANTKPDETHKIYEVSDEISKLIGEIEVLKADGGTNTGDGLRQAYYLHKNFREIAGKDEKDPVHHYMILLVDGETTYEVKNGTWTDKGKDYEKVKYNYNTGGHHSSSNYYYYYKWKTNWQNTHNGYFTGAGNIDVKHDQRITGKTGNYQITKPSDAPLNIDKPPIKNKKYGEKNEPKEYIVITGNGSTTISNSGYIWAIGDKINQFKNEDIDKSKIKSYIIGYAKDLEDNINYIGEAIGTDPTKIYAYNKDFDISEVFQDIANDIMADFWIVAGPQIQK